MSIRSLFIVTGLLSLLAVPAVPVYAAGSGGGSAPIPTRERSFTPEQMSAKSFRAGIKNRDRALKYEARAADASKEKTRDKFLARAQKEYAKAIKKQGEAIRMDPQNYKAANELGFAYRKTGDYRKAIAAYNFALEINPNYHPATEYRGEAFLALGLYDLTKRAYMTLFRNDRALADQLMGSFEAWADQKTDPTSDDEQDFLAWIAERKRLADMADKLSLHSPQGESAHWPAS
ncbi:MAG: tetratricopeptide repeat protein [Pseudomonadales bacterium]